MPRRKASRNLTPKDWKNIKILTKKAVGIAGILEDDCPDIEQELAIALWRESRKFSKRQSSWSTYSCIVLKKYLQKIIRTRKQPKSHYSCNANMSLNILITDQEYPEWAFEVIDLVNTDGLLEDWTSSPEHKGISLKIDMDKFISNMLDRDLQRICELLKTNRIGEAAKILGISRTTLYSKIKIIKKGMQGSDLRSYLLNSN